RHRALPVRLRPGGHGLATRHTGREAGRRVDLGRDRRGRHDGNDGPGLGEAGRQRTARHDRHSPGRRVGLRGEAGGSAEARREEEVTGAERYKSAIFAHFLCSREPPDGLRSFTRATIPGRGIKGEGEEGSEAEVSGAWPKITPG